MAVFECQRAGVCVCEAHTEQDGDSGHHTAAQGENDAAGYVREVRGFDGHVEIECIEDPGRTQKRDQHREESGDSAALTACALAAAALPPIRSLPRSHASLSLALGAPHSQLHALRRRPYQRPTLVHSAVQIGGFWTPSRCVCAVGNVSLRGRGWRADAVFRGGVQIARRDDRTGKSLIQLPLLPTMCSRLLWETDARLLVARSRACSNQSTFKKKPSKAISCRLTPINHSLSYFQNTKQSRNTHINCSYKISN